LRIFAAGFRHIGAAAAFTTDGLRHFASQLAGVHLGRQILGDAAMIETFESSADASNNYARLPFIAQRIGQRAQLLRSMPSSLAASTFTSLMVRGLLLEIAQGGLGQLFLSCSTCFSSAF